MTQMMGKKKGTICIGGFDISAVWDQEQNVWQFQSPVFPNQNEQSSDMLEILSFLGQFKLQSQGAYLKQDGDGFLLLAVDTKPLTSFEAFEKIILPFLDHLTQWQEVVCEHVENY